MDVDLKVRVAYRNKKMETVQECEYDLKDYLDVMSMDMKRLISDVEDLAYIANGGAFKDEWSDEEILAFNKVKHKLLDKAGELSRLYGNLYDGDKENKDKPSSFWWGLFEKEKE